MGSGFLYLHRLHHSLTLTFVSHYKIYHEAHRYTNYPEKTEEMCNLASLPNKTLQKEKQPVYWDSQFFFWGFLMSSRELDSWNKSFFFDMGCRNGFGVCQDQLWYPVTDFVTGTGQAEDRLSFHHFWTEIPPLTLKYYPHTGILASLLSC